MRNFLLGPLKRAGWWRRSWDSRPPTGQREEAKKDGDGELSPRPVTSGPLSMV